MSGPVGNPRVIAILRKAKVLARRYYKLIGRPLGITGEVAEAARLLRVQLTPARQAGYDAVERRNGTTRRLQIKGRCLLPNCKPGQRLGSIDINGSPGRRSMPTDDPTRLRAALDQIANALQPAIIVAGQLHQTSAAAAHDAAVVESAITRAVVILKDVQRNRP